MKKLVFSLSLLLLLGTFALAETYEHKEAEISIWFPDDWSVTTDEDLMIAEPVDGDAYFMLDVIPDSDTLEEAIEAYISILDSYFEEFQATGDPKKFESNGLKIWGISGKAQRNGTVLLVDVMLFDTEEAVVICINSTNEDAADKYKSEFEQIAASIKKAVS